MFLDSCRHPTLPCLGKQQNQPLLRSTYLFTDSSSVTWRRFATPQPRSRLCERAENGWIFQFDDRPHTQRRFRKTPQGPDEGWRRLDQSKSWRAITHCLMSRIFSTVAIHFVLSPLLLNLHRERQREIAEERARNRRVRKQQVLGEASSAIVTWHNKPYSWLAAFQRTFLIFVKPCDFFEIFSQTDHQGNLTSRIYLSWNEELWKSNLADRIELKIKQLISWIGDLSMKCVYWKTDIQWAWILFHWIFKRYSDYR